MGSPGPSSWLHPRPHPARAPTPLAAGGHWAACPEQSPFPTLGRPDFQCPAFPVGRPTLGDPAVPLSRCFQATGEEDASPLSPWGSQESSGPGWWGGGGKGEAGTCPWCWGGGRPLLSSNCISGSSAYLQGTGPCPAWCWPWGLCRALCGFWGPCPGSPALYYSRPSGPGGWCGFVGQHVGRKVHMLGSPGGRLIGQWCPGLCCVWGFGSDRWGCAEEHRAECRALPSSLGDL